MATRFQTGGGDKIKLFVSLLPLGSRTEPVDIVNVSPGTDITVNSTTFTFATPPASVIPGGTPILLTTPAAGTVLGFSGVVYPAIDVPAGATAMTIVPAKISDAMIAASYSAFPSASTGTIVAKSRLLGGTSTGKNIGADRTSSLVFEDALGYEDGIITSQNWDIPWTANLLADDLAYRRVVYAATNAIEGRELYVWLEEAPPAGSTSGDQTKGAVVVTNFSQDFPSDGILTFSCTFSGQGSPTYIPAVL